MGAISKSRAVSRGRLGTPTAIVFILCVTGTIAGFAQDTARHPETTALRGFQERLRAYVALRADVARGLPPLRNAASAEAIAARTQAMAAGMRAKRPNARQGDVIPPDAAAVLAATVRDDYARRTSSERRGELAEVPAGAPPQVNQTFPGNAALATVPPLLLAAMPRLPEGLQYRFFGRHLLLLDDEAGIIVDYVADVLPVR